MTRWTIAEDRLIELAESGLEPSAKEQQILAESPDLQVELENYRSLFLDLSDHSQPEINDSMLNSVLPGVRDELTRKKYPLPGLLSIFSRDLLALRVRSLASATASLFAVIFLMFYLVPEPSKTLYQLNLENIMAEELLQPGASTDYLAMTLSKDSEVKDLVEESYLNDDIVSGDYDLLYNYTSESLLEEIDSMTDEEFDQMAAFLEGNM